MAFNYKQYNLLLTAQFADCLIVANHLFYLIQ